MNSSVLVICSLTVIHNVMHGHTDKLSYPQLGPPWPKREKPQWLDKGLVVAGKWEPLSWFYRKNIGDITHGNALAGSAAAERYAIEESEETVIGLKNLGVNMVVTGFHKGFGIENERETMERAARYAETLHKHGMKMGTYVSALLLYEELYAEFPEARNWHRRLYSGEPEGYPSPEGFDGYRYRAFLNHPEYINYMKRVCELAVEAGSDLIFFDTVSMKGTNHHPLAEEMFRDWLREKYPTVDQWFFRSGLHYWNYVKIPHYGDRLRYSTYDHPIIQEYIRFTCELFENYAAEMCTFIHSLNSETAILFNSHGVFGDNNYLLRETDHEKLHCWLDCYYAEGERNDSHYTADGVLDSKIRSMKLGQLSNSVMISYTSKRTPKPRLMMAESMAFNRQCLGNVGKPMDYRDMPESMRRYIRFFWDHFDLFEQMETAAEVAVLRSFASMAYNNYDAQREVMLAEQTLIQRQIPFDIIFDEHLEDLSKYKVVILANQESLSDKQLEQLNRYVSGGGGIVATADAGKYNEWRRIRVESGLKEVTGISQLAVKGSEDELTERVFFERGLTLTQGAGGKEPEYDGKMYRHNFGKGRGVYLPELIPAVPVPPRSFMRKQYWHLPNNVEAFIEGIRYAADGRLDFEIQAPDCVAVETYRQPSQDRYIVHLVNYDAWRRSRIRNITIDVNIRNAWDIEKATVFSPDETASQELRMTRTQTGMQVAVPALHIYSVIALER